MNVLSDYSVAIPFSWCKLYSDAGRFKPMSVFEKPSTWWWQDGFGKSSTPEYAHHRLIPYGLMRLTKGSNIVYFCGSEHGRMCRPNYGIGLCP